MAAAIRLDSPAWNSAATDVHSPGRTWSGFIDDLTDLLHVGTNILAIQGLNYSTSDPSFLILPQLSANVTGIFGTDGRYFVTPTPGKANGNGSADLGPVVSDVSEPATQPAAGGPVVVTAKVTQTINPIQSSSVILHYRVMYNTEYTVAMYDDGTHNDAVSGDGLYTGTIPAGAATAGQMLRWYVSATDTLAHSGRWPLLVPIIGDDGGPEYQGTVIADPTLTSTLPIFQSFIVNPSAADNWSDRTGTRGSVYYLGQFYDNVFVRLPRRLYHEWKQVQIQFRLRFHFCGRSRPRHANQPQPTRLGRILCPAHAGLRNHERRRRPASIVFPMRVQRNNSYYMVMSFIENVDKHLLDAKASTRTTQSIKAIRTYADLPPPASKPRIAMKSQAPTICSNFSTDCTSPISMPAASSFTTTSISRRCSIIWRPSRS